MKGSAWGWQPARSQGIWQFGPLWLKPLVAAAPWLTVLTLLAMFWVIGGTFTSAEGILFDLPDSGLSEGERTSLVALVMPMRHDTLVFFDDARYSMDDGVSSAAFAEHLAGRVQPSDPQTLLLLVDRRVPGGEIAKLAALARMSGVRRILFATKGGGDGDALREREE